MAHETTRAQLQAYYLIYQLRHELARSDYSTIAKLDAVTEWRHSLASGLRTAASG